MTDCACSLHLCRQGLLGVLTAHSSIVSRKMYNNLPICMLVHFRMAELVLTEPWYSPSPQLEVPECALLHLLHSACVHFKHCQCRVWPMQPAAEQGAGAGHFAVLRAGAESGIASGASHELRGTWRSFNHPLHACMCVMKCTKTCTTCGSNGQYSGCKHHVCSMLVAP